MKDLRKKRTNYFQNTNKTYQTNNSNICNDYSSDYVNISNQDYLINNQRCQRFIENISSRKKTGISNKMTEMLNKINLDALPFLMSTNRNSYFSIDKSIGNKIRSRRKYNIENNTADRKDAIYKSKNFHLVNNSNEEDDFRYANNYNKRMQRQEKNSNGENSFDDYQKRGNNLTLIVIKKKINNNNDKTNQRNKYHYYNEYYKLSNNNKINFNNYVNNINYNNDKNIGIKNKTEVNYLKKKSNTSTRYDIRKKKSSYYYITKLQALIRGFLLRQNQINKLEKYNTALILLEKYITNIFYNRTKFLFIELVSL